MKNRRKYIALLMAMLFAFSMQVPISARDAADYVPIQPLWQNVNNANATLTLSGTTATCRATIVALSGTTSISATMRLQRISLGSAITVQMWTGHSSSFGLSMEGTATVSANGNYRLQVDATVVRNGVSERISITG
jgi:hypothetical protein